MAGQSAFEFGLLCEGDGIAAEGDVDEHIGAAVGDVQQRRAVIGGAERHDFLGDLLPALLLGEFGEAIMDGVGGSDHASRHIRPENARHTL